MGHLGMFATWSSGNKYSLVSLSLYSAVKHVWLLNYLYMYMYVHLVQS